MQRSRWPLFFLILALGCTAIAGFVRLFDLRYAAGDIYPPYSSLRADPLGAEVLYDALGEGGFQVSRNFLPLDKISNPEHSTILYAGAPIDDWAMQDVKDMESLASGGARIVITFLPQDEVSRKAKPLHTPEPAKTRKPKDDRTDEEEESFISPAELAKRWNLNLSWRTATSRAGEATPTLIAHAAISGPERSIPWHTALYFAKPSAVQRVIYRCDGLPVLLERKYGKGSFVFASDSYFLSNEAMRSDRAPRLLAWLFGPQSAVVFDETHLGVRENPGIASLARKYGLQGFAGAILVLAALFVWEAGSPFLPPRHGEAESEIVAGNDSTSGFVSLLRRGIPASQLLSACLEQWKKSFAHRPEKMAAKLARIEAHAADADPVAAYQTITQILAEKK
ncbi:MAG TPA: DUF4350 domain-containing protein [Chthoniobacteraceae bacterium]|jgi:hypothetical protein|nr:DUF4350 domain-containing protein [Chthoniobacteraceae bacterium]